MKSRLWIGAIALAGAVAAGGWLMAADDKKSDDPKAHGVLPKDFKKLGLSDKQTQDIYKIEASYKDKIAVLQQQLDDLKEAERKEIDAVLTDEQKTRLKELLVPVPDATTTKPTTTTAPPPAPDKDKPAPPKDK